MTHHAGLEASPRPMLALAATAVSASALGGAIALMGGGLRFPDDLATRLPWESHGLAGLALLLWVAVPFALLAVSAWRADPRTARLSIAAGLALVAWIVVQVAVIRAFSWFQPTYLAVGAAFVWAGRSGQPSV